MMSLKKTFRILAVMLMIAASCFTGMAANRITASLDSANVLMGRTTVMHLKVEQNSSTRGYLPLFRVPSQTGYVGVCGDSVELRYPHQIDTVRDGNRMTVNYAIIVQSFDSGTYQLPRVAFVEGVDTAWSGPLQLTVRPVVGVTADTPIADYANVADPENSSIFDVLPDWMVNYWWAILLALAACGAGFWIWKRYQKNGTILPKKPEPTPNEVAEKSLQELKEKKLWEQGLEKEYYTELTDILRRYLYGRFGINAIEMTSRQILYALGANPDLREKRKMIRQILDMADFVKFAKVRPLPADNISAYDNAWKFVIETRPVVNDNNQSDAEQGGKGESMKTTDSNSRKDTKVLEEDKKGGER